MLVNKYLNPNCRKPDGRSIGMNIIYCNKREVAHVIGCPARFTELDF